MKLTAPQTAKQIFGEAIEKPPSARSAFLELACGSDAALRGEVEALLAAFDAADEFLISREAQSAPTGSSASEVLPDSFSDSGDLQAAVDSDAVTQLNHGQPPEAPGAQIGRYKLLQEIGHGGFGTVFMAEQREPVVRKVALKVIKLGMDTRQTLARFAAERQALAMMDHPNIARVLDAGATDTGRPYFVMELVRGERITDYCDQQTLSITDRLDLFTQVCHAVQHAHTKGVIHRDIKPSNVLVTTADDKPIPKVIDFGIAKAVTGRLTDQTLFTEFRQLVGTPAYMSPEQADVGSADIDTRSDVYSLGVLLYELLTGTTPFDDRALNSAGYDEMRRIIREVEPPRPSTRVASDLRVGRREGEAPAREGESPAEPPPALGVAQPPPAVIPPPYEGEGRRGVAPSLKSQASVLDAASASRASSLEHLARFRRTDPSSLSRLLRGDLDWIVMKCLEKDRTRRYETANGLAMDIGRYLAAEPVIAAPPSAMYRARRFIRRNRRMVGALAAVLVMLLVAIGGTTYGMFRAYQAEKKAAKDAQEARRQADIASAVTDFLNDDFFGSLKELANDPTMNFAGMRTVLEQAGKRLDEASQPGGRFANEPLIQLRLRKTIADALHDSGAVDRSVPHYERVLRLTIAEHGADSAEANRMAVHLSWVFLRLERPNDAQPIVLDLVERTQRLYGPDAGDARPLQALSQLAWLHKLEGNIAAQRSMVERLIEDWTVLYERRKLEVGPQHPDTIWVLGNIAHETDNLGRFVEAEPRARELIELRRMVLGDDHPDTRHARHLLRCVLSNLGQYQEPLALAEQVLESTRKKYGPEHPFTIADLQRTAWQLHLLGRYEEAEKRYNESLEFYRRVLGEAHPDYLSCREELSSVFLFSDRLREAEEIRREELAIQKRVYGEQHPFTLNAMHGLGGVFQWQGRSEEAERLFLEVLEARRSLLGEDDPQTLDIRNDLGWLRQQQGRYAEAAELHEQTLKARRRVLGEDHLVTVLSMHNLGIQYSILGRYVEAESLLRKVLSVRVPAVGEAHPETIDTRSILGATLIRGGKVEEGLELLERGLQIAERAHREETRYGVLTMNHLAEAYQRSGRLQDAERMYKRAIATAPRASGSEHPEMLHPMSNLGWLYNEQKRFAEGEEILARLLSIRRRVLGEGHRDTINSIKPLADSLRGLGKTEESRTLLSELIAARRTIAERDGAAAMELNEYAWLLLTVEPEDLRDYALALDWATRAWDVAQKTNVQGVLVPNILDTLALAQHRTGDTATAIQTQRQAIELLPADASATHRADFETRLAEFEQAFKPTSRSVDFEDAGPADGGPSQ